MDPEELLATGRAALRIGDAETARQAFLAAPRTAAALEGLSTASYVLMEYPRAIDELEAAYAAHREAADGVGAARAARTLGYLYGSTAGDWAVANGWISRAKDLLVDDPGSSERGWIALTEGMWSEERSTKERLFEQALQRGRATGDTDLTFASAAYLGASMVHGDRTRPGMALLDEALAAVAGGEVEDYIIIEEIFCQMFSACEYAQDVDRAEQWMRVGEQVARRRGLPTVAAYCRTHYGGILTSAGRWSEADLALTEAVRLWTLGHRTLKAGALVRLADLRVKQGRYDEAAHLLDDLADNADAVRPLAALHLARGESALARELLEHAVLSADPGTSACLPLLALLADAQLACGDDPTATVEAMAECAERHPGTYATALLASRRGRLAAARGEESASVWLRDALRGFEQAHLPFEAALCRLDLARVCRARPPVAVDEARAALKAFGRLESARYVAEAASLLRDLGERVAPPRPKGVTLTRREQEVLELIGSGLSNPEIAARLFISRKTAEHHVGNILAKLGLRNRAEAAAYVVLQEPARE